MGNAKRGRSGPRPYARRTYRSPRQLWNDLVCVLRQRHQIRPLMRGQRLSPAFRERLMLAVTQTNRCRYCAAFHGYLAQHAGVSARETGLLLDGIVGDSPAAEQPALLYARQWAASNAAPGDEARRQLVEHYGAATAQDIELALRLIRIGNLSGNLVDLAAYRLSRGRFGG